MVLVLCRGMCCVVACCVVALCFGALGCTLVCGIGHCHTVMCVVTWRFVALYSMLRSVMAYRCLVVCCGLIFLVVGLVVVCCVSALRGVVFLFCWLCPIVVPCSSVGLCRVVLSRGFVVACPLWCCVVLCCVVVSVLCGVAVCVVSRYAVCCVVV